MLEDLNGALSGCMLGKEPSRHPCRFEGKIMRGRIMGQAQNHGGTES